MAKAATQTTPKNETEDTSKTVKSDFSPLGDNTKLTLVISKEKIAPAYQSALSRAQQSIKSDGFRKGKTPLSMVEKMVDQEKLINLTLEKMLPVEYTNLIEKENRKPLTAPEIKIVSADKGADWTLEIEIAERPEIKLKDYKKTAAKALKDSEKVVAQRVEEFKKHLEEHEKTGDTSHTHEHNELTDQQKEEIRLQEVFKALLEENPISIPQLLIKEDVRRQLDGLVRQLRTMNMTIDDYLNYQKRSFDEFSGQLAVQALANYQLEFILDEIRILEKIEATQEDLENYLKKIESKSTLKDLDEKAREQLQVSANRRKVLDWFLSL